jgi:hypothetical protein
MLKGRKNDQRDKESCKQNQQETDTIHTEPQADPEVLHPA